MRILYSMRKVRRVSPRNKADSFLIERFPILDSFDRPCALILRYIGDTEGAVSLLPLYCSSENPLKILTTNIIRPKSK